jgi:hypothetical protein
MAATVARSIGKAPGHGFANHQRLQPRRASRAPRRSIVAPIVAALPGLIGRCPRQIRRTIFPSPAQRATLAEVTKQREIGQSYFIGIELESEHESPAIERSAQRDDERLGRDQATFVPSNSRRLYQLSRPPMPRAWSRWGNIFAKPDRRGCLRARARIGVCFHIPCIRAEGRA